MDWSLILTTAGLLLAVVLFIRSRERPRPRYQHGGVILVDENIPSDLSISFKGETVPRVMLSRLVVWNDGRATLDGGDVADRDPLRIEVADGVVLHAEVETRTRDVNGVAVSFDDGAPSLLLEFDFLDPQDGAVISVLHTGPHWYAIRVAGTIKGIGKGIEYAGRMETPGEPSLPGTRVVPRTGFILGLLMVGIGTTEGLGVSDLFTFTPGEPENLWWVTAASGGLLVVSGASTMWITRRRFPKALDPDDGPTSPDQSRDEL